MDGGSLSDAFRTVAIVQARMGSSRLPGKMMMALGGRPLLFWVLYRVKKANLIDSIILATTQNRLDDSLVDLAQQLDIDVYRGSEEDVLGRFLGAATSAGAGKIVRVCADNPLVAPEEIDRLVDTYSTVLKRQGYSKRLYVFNHGPKLQNDYPNGLGGEIFSLDLLQRLDELCVHSQNREHVCSYIWEHPNDYSIHAFKAPKEIAFPDIKLDVDTQEDFARLNILCAKLNWDCSTSDIVNVYNQLFNDPR